MTEAEWLASEGPVRMLARLGDAPSGRQLRLFACACARAAWGLLVDPRSRGAVEVVERYVEGSGSAAGRREAEEAANQAQYEVWLAGGGSAGSPVRTREWSASLYAFWATRDEAALRAYYQDNGESMRAAPAVAAQAALMRDVFGGLVLGPPAAGGRRRSGGGRGARRPAWVSTGALSIAEAAYEERGLPGGELDAVRLAVLADALEEGGCADAAVLAHLRGPGPHVRGCWALDRVLGRG